MLRVSQSQRPASCQFDWSVSGSAKQVSRGRRLAWGFGLLDGLEKSASHALVDEQVGERADRRHDADQPHRLAAVRISVGWAARSCQHDNKI